MFDAPVDAWYVWLGLALVSVAVFGVGLSLATPPPPSADRLANAVDSVAASPYGAVRTIAVDADYVSLTPWEVGLRSDGGAAHARVTYGPITPARTGSLEAILRGRAPSTLFESSERFRAALARARNRSGEWLVVPDQLTARRISWGGIDATLVG